MNIYDIFRSEGGYRVCKATWGNDPIISSCPWFETEEEAKNEVKKLKFEECTYDIRMFEEFQAFREKTKWVVEIGANCYTYDTKEEAKNRIISEIEKLGYERSYILDNRRDLR